MLVHQCPAIDSNLTCRNQACHQSLHAVVQDPHAIVLQESSHSSLKNMKHFETCLCLIVLITAPKPWVLGCFRAMSHFIFTLCWWRGRIPLKTECPGNFEATGSTIFMTFHELFHGPKRGNMRSFLFGITPKPWVVSLTKSGFSMPLNAYNFTYLALQNSFWMSPFIKMSKRSSRRNV